MLSALAMRAVPLSAHASRLEICSKLYQGRRQFVQDSQDDFGPPLTAFTSQKLVLDL